MNYQQIKTLFYSLSFKDRENKVIERQADGDYLLKTVRYKLNWNDKR